MGQMIGQGVYSKVYSVKSPTSNRSYAYKRNTCSFTQHIICGIIYKNKFNEKTRNRDLSHRELVKVIK